MRTTPLLSLVVAALTGLALGGCPTHVVSPPTQFLPLESAAPLARGDTYLGLEGGIASAMFGPEIPGGALVVRHGLADDLELRVEGSAGWIVDESPSDDFRGIVSGRVGFKGLISKDFPHAAWIGGVGGGGSAGGGFLAADSGVIFAYENPYIVPFLRLALFASVPVGAREVDITHFDEGGEDDTFDTPHTTLGVRVGVGARIPIDPVDVTFGMSFVQLIDTRGEEIGIIGLSAGVGTTF